MIQPGDKVRLSANPGRVGIVGSETDGSPGRLRVLVQFTDGEEEFVLAVSLEKVEKSTLGPYDMLRKGRYGRASDLRGLITHYRLSGKLANLIYSLNTTNSEFLAYQFKPVLQYLESPSQGLLIADEVGLGKTIEAGLVWTELRAREDAKRLLVVCPAMLCEKWKDELRDRFGADAEIVNARQLLQRLREVREDRRKPFALVASLQGLRPPSDWEDGGASGSRASAKLAAFLRESEVDEPLIDLAVVDEAHYLRNRETQTHTLGELIRAASLGMLMLTATPIQLHSRDLFSLLHLLDADGFAYEYSFADLLESNEPLVRLRDRVLNSHVPQQEFVELLDEARAAPLLADSRQLQLLRHRPPADMELKSVQRRTEIADQLDRVNPLSKVISRTLKRDVQENRVERSPHVIRVTMAPVEAEFYDEVTKRVREYCEGQDISVGFMLTIPQRQMSSCMAAACQEWVHKAKSANTDELERTVYEAFGDDDELKHSKPALGPLLSQLATVARERNVAEGLAAIDTKYALLLNSLEDYWRRYPGKKIILFSFYRGTLSYLAKRLTEDGYSCFVLHGGMDKQARINEFREQTGASILLSSEVASEGVDLQFCSMVINYDLPWNPSKVEQRIGRIDRIGQEESKVLIWNFVYSNSIDERIYDRLLVRLDIFKRALGSMEATIGQEIRQLGYALLSHCLSPKKEAERIERSRMALANRERFQTELENEATNLIAHGNLIQNKVRAARELGRYIRGIDLKHYVVDFFDRNYPGTRFVGQPNKDLAYEINFSTQARADIEAYLSANRELDRTNILRSGKLVIKFDNRAGRVRSGFEKITQDHPLVRFTAKRSRLSGTGHGYLPVTAVTMTANIDTAAEPGNYVYAVTRWSVTGARSLERLEYSVQGLDSGAIMEDDDAEQLVNDAALHGRDWISTHNELDGARVAVVYEHMRDRLEQRFNEFVQMSEMENLDRIDQMVNSLRHHLAEKRERVEDRIKRYRESGDERRTRLIPAEKGRLAKEESRINDRIGQLELRKELDKQSSFVSAGVIHVA